MHLLFPLLLVNVLILIVFKLYPKYEIDTFKAILINYFVCFLTGSLLLQQVPLVGSGLDKPWLIYAVALGIIFIISFNFAALTVQRIGMMIGTLFQKMSLLFPIIFAVIFFSEKLGMTRGLGVLLAIVSIVIINIPRKGENENELQMMKKYWYLPVFTMLGSGLIEIILYYVNKVELIVNEDVEFVCSVYLMAGICGILTLLLKKDFTFGIKELIGGICLGVPNFFTIYWLVVALSMEVPASIIFPFLNVGVIVCSIMVGFWFFAEKIDFYKGLGMLIALLAIFMILI